MADEDKALFHQLIAISLKATISLHIITALKCIILYHITFIHINLVYI